MGPYSRKALTRGPRRGRGVGGTRDDAYLPTKKVAGPVVCPVCRAVCQRGRWSWTPVPDAAAEHECPACRRTRDGMPAGRIRLEGEFGARRAEILSLVLHREAAEKADHPLERIMTISEEPWGLSITTTGVHVARRIAEALRKAWHERIEIRYAKSQDLVRVTWKHESEPAAARRPLSGGRS